MKHHEQPPETVRFWDFINDGWVRLSLRRGQTLTWGRCSRHDEGWSSEYSHWSFDGERITQEYGTDGTDCDGRLSSAGTLFTTPEKLKAVPAYGAPVIFRPEWTKVDSRQRDYSAEAMNY